MDMVDEKKTILMTKLAIFEKHEKNKNNMHARPRKQQPQNRGKND